MAASEDYSVKNVSSAAQLRALFTEFVLPEGWMPALDDHTLYYNTDPTGFYIGELNGKPIALLSVVKYGDNFGFVGLYIVLKEYRGQGYGLKLFKEVLGPFFTSEYNLALDGVQSMVAMYRQWGFVDAFVSTRAQLNVATALEKLKNFNSPSDVLVQSASAVDFNKLSAYDSEVFGAPHQLFLQGLLDGPNTITMAATNQNGDVVGFVAARKMIILEDRWRLAPLFADNAQIARVLLKVIFKEMLMNAADRKITMFELFVSNPDASALAEELAECPAII